MKNFSDFRKSYKPLINSNIKKYKPKLMNYTNFDEKIWLNLENYIKKLQEKSLESDTWDHQKKL